MKSLFIEKEQMYNGTQLSSLYAYLNYHLLGDSVVAWLGPCNISFEHMVDGEDLLQKAEIRGDKMLHFIIEIFDRDLFSGVAIQRLFASIVRDYLQSRVQSTNVILKRDGDDIYWGQKKLSISIATKSPVSTMVHFAMNIVNEGTPVSTTCLQDLGLEPENVAKELMNLLSAEFKSIKDATQKVRPVK